MRPANSALAATGRKPGACGSSRVTTPKPIRNAISARSVHRVDDGWADFGELASIDGGSLWFAAKITLPRSGGAVFHPFGDDLCERIQPVGQRRRARLQDDGGFDLAQETIGDGGYCSKSGPGGDFGGHEFLAAPGADDDVGPGRDDRFRQDDSVLGVFAAG